MSQLTHIQTQKPDLQKFNVRKFLEETAMAKANPIQLQKHLKGMDYPASKEDLVQHAQKHGADKEALSIFEQLPEDEYETPADVSKAIGQLE